MNVILLNNLPASNPHEGSAAQCFLCCTPRIGLAGTSNIPISKEEGDKIIRKRDDRQNKVQLKLDRNSADKFIIGDKVRVYDSYKGNWGIKGRILVCFS